MDREQVYRLVKLLRTSQVPSDRESSTHSVDLRIEKKLLANSYLAIVAICHQTSPIGERRLEGFINNVRKVGWDYLKEKFLIKVTEQAEWASPHYWLTLTPLELSELYNDQTMGKTLNRINERTFFLNDLGRRLEGIGSSSIEDEFRSCRGVIGGDGGFLAFLKTFEAYKDPVMKKAQFFIAIMMNELGWVIADRENLSSPVDYHELRGHLRIGTLVPDDPTIALRIEKGLPLTAEEDIEIRRQVQEINDLIAMETALGSSVVHYLFWNVFRNCCPRESMTTHCLSCGDRCGLPDQYKRMETYEKKCLFSEFCHSVGREDKVTDPPYIGHYY